LFSPVSRAAESPSIRGREAEAIAVALHAFKSKQDSTYQGKPVYGDLRHYSVVLARHAKTIEVIFVPDADPQSKTGGSTDYGWEVHYMIQLKTLTILKEDYAR
jgi:hypothetical protein